MPRRIPDRMLKIMVPKVPPNMIIRYIAASSMISAGVFKRCNIGRVIATPQAVTVCIHGDGPNAIEIAQTVKKTLQDNGVTLSNLKG